MMYFILKYLHVVGAAVSLGTGAEVTGMPVGPLTAMEPSICAPRGSSISNVWSPPRVRGGFEALLTA